MTTYVTENMICDCCGAVVLGETRVKPRYYAPRPEPNYESMCVTGDICPECANVLQEAFSNVSELQRMKRGVQEPELPEAKALRLEEENEKLKLQLSQFSATLASPALWPAPSPSDKRYDPPYGAPLTMTMQEQAYRAQIERMKIMKELDAATNERGLPTQEQVEAVKKLMARG